MNFQPSRALLYGTSLDMATVLPPPSKRQRVAAATKAREQQEIDTAIPDGNVRIRFSDRATGEAIGPPVYVPLAHASVKNLQQLVNSLKGHEEDDRLPYQFFYGDQALGDAADVYGSLMQKGTATSGEEILDLQVAPQAVFRVRAVSQCSAAISGHGAPILTAAFSPGSSARFASGGGDNTARLWDCETGTPISTLKGHTSWVLAISYAPDDNVIATGSMDNTVRLWDSKTGKPLGTPLKGHTKWVTALAWQPYHLQEPGRSLLASSSKDCTVRVWDTTSRRADIVLSGHKGSVSCVRWGGTGFIYTSSHDKMIKVWNSADGTLHATLSAHAHWVNHLALSTDFVLRTGPFDHERGTASSGSVAALSDAEKRQRAKLRFDKAATINNALVERLVSASDDLTIHLWDPLHSTKPIARLVGHQKQVNHVTFSPNGLFVASAGFDNHVKLWSAVDGKFIATLRGHVGPVYQCCFSADSRLLVSASRDTTLKVWDVRTAKLKEDLPGHKDEVYAVDWSPDGQRVGSGGKDKQVRIWRG